MNAKLITRNMRSNLYHLSGVPAYCPRQRRAQAWRNRMMASRFDARDGVLQWNACGCIYIVALEDL